LLSPGHFHGWRLPSSKGTYRCKLPISLPPLASGHYGFDVATMIHGAGPDHLIPNAITFETSAHLEFPVQWELLKEYNAGFLVLDSGQPTILDGRA
jgi:hypothetical protein